VSTDIGFSTSAAYQRSDFQDEDRTDDTYSLRAGLTYQLSSDASAFGVYNFRIRDSTDSDESYYENAVTVGVRIVF
jgi:uncharacterized protein (PEP-CTERM system associated)